MTTWLSDEEQHLWRSLLYGMTQAMNALDEGVQRRSGLPLTDYEILVVLSENPGQHLRMSELAKRVVVSRSRLTYRIDQLIDRGLVSRRDCDDDRRGVLAQLTPKGARVLAEAAPGHVADVRRMIIDHVPDEARAWLTALFESMAEAATCESSSARASAALEPPPSLRPDNVSDRNA